MIFSRVPDQSRVFRIIEESRVPIVIIERMDDYGAGVMVPRDVSSVGLDNVPVSWLVSAMLTTVAQPFAEMSFLSGSSYSTERM